MDFIIQSWYTKSSIGGGWNEGPPLPWIQEITELVTVEAMRKSKHVFGF